MIQKLTLAFFLLIPLLGFSQNTHKVLYKQIDSTDLYLEIYQPTSQPAYKPTSPLTHYPTMIFFFGGGWNGGSVDQFRPHAEYFSRRGMVTILADYRVKSRNQTSPFESLMDAKSALRFIRKNAKTYNIDPDKIVAAGGSAGGHLAAATAIINGYDDPMDNLSISCIPNALVLFNPVIDNGPGGYGYERIGAAYKNFSPLHNLKKGNPPTILFLGTKDVLIPVETAEYYKTIAQRIGNRCELHLYDGAGHGFFNARNQAFYAHTIDKTDHFLESLGYINTKGVRSIIDTIGFAQYDWQMDSILHRLQARVEPVREDRWKAVIAPHDDFKYAGEVTMEALAGIKAKTVILFGVAHKARNFGLEDKLIFGSHSHWEAAYGKIPVSPLRNEIIAKLDEKHWMIQDDMQEIEHSLEAITPFLQSQNRFIEIIPILVPAMNFKKMENISSALSKVLAQIFEEKGWALGKEVALVISNDAIHYGDEEWGGKNLAPMGSGEKGNAKALAFEQEIIQTCLAGELSSKKMKKFTAYTVQKEDHRAYKWTWCGRYALPMGLLVANKVSQKMEGQPLMGHFLQYATSIDHAHFPVEDLGMGITAIATKRHWVGYVGMGYK